MKRIQKPSLSLISRGARFQFAVGIALVSIIPALSLWYLRVIATPGWEGYGIEHLLVAGTILLCGASGYVILRKYPINIVRLRGYLEQMVDGELPTSVDLMKAEDDILAVENYLKLIIGQLREKLDTERSEKESLQHQLYQAQKMESLGVMAAGVAHDFNNFLTGIMGNADLVLQRGELEGPAKETVHDIKKLALRASDLTRTMLTYSGRGRFVMEDLDVLAVVEDMTQLLKASVGAGVDLVSETVDEVPKIQADPAQIRQLLMNLVINGADALREDGGRIEVGVEPVSFGPTDVTETYVDGRVPEGLYVCLRVKDSGCGMSPETVARMFDPFFTTKPEGRGLGLAVVLGIIRSHEGYMEVDSSPNQGTTFAVYLPVPRVAGVDGAAG